jgi:hypothetical protein
MIFRIAAATGISVLLVWLVGAPAVPVAAGAGLACAWLLWRAAAAR